MSKTLNFYGASDDLFEVEGAIREEIGCFNELGIYHLKSAEGEVLVVATYTDEGCWAIGLCQVGEDVPVPAWPVSYSMHERGYSVQLTMEVPDDTQLVMANEDDE
ncbi:hypothetical protein [Serratia nevei]|uniref:hypothetical protein n=1 Tax=Serratia nevei TaxID=2703794 RepID=UPI001A2F33CB|nr:hypothetical protein [Serratia marcescens]